VDRQEFEELLGGLREAVEDCRQCLGDDACTLWDPDWSCPAIPPAAIDQDEAFPGVASLLDEDESGPRELPTQP